MRASSRRSRIWSREAVAPDYALGAHVAALGLAYADRHMRCRSSLTNGMFVGEHGSWNRKPPAGYKVVFVPFVNGKPSGMPLDVLTGFVSEDRSGHGPSRGRRHRRRGALLVADDVGNVIWRVVGK